MSSHYDDDNDDDYNDNDLMEAIHASLAESKSSKHRTASKRSRSEQDDDAMDDDAAFQKAVYDSLSLNPEATKRTRSEDAMSRIVVDDDDDDDDLQKAVMESLSANKKASKPNQSKGRRTTKSKRQPAMVDGYAFPSDISFASEDDWKKWSKKDRSQDSVVLMTTGILESAQDYLRYTRAVNEPTQSKIASVAGLAEENIVLCCPNSAPFEPAFCVALDEAKKRIVLAIRGTQNFYDAVTDIQISPSEFRSGYVHGGFMKAADYVYKSTIDILKELKRTHEDYAIRIVGHSLGGGVATLFTLKAASELPGLRTVVFGAPPCVSKNLVPETKKYITAFVNGNDIVPRLAAGSFRDVIDFIVNLLYPDPAERIDTSSFGDGRGIHTIIEAIRSVLCKDKEASPRKGSPSLQTLPKILEEPDVLPSLQLTKQLLQRLHEVSSSRSSVKLPACLSSLITEDIVSLIKFALDMTTLLEFMAGNASTVKILSDCVSGYFKNILDNLSRKMPNVNWLLVRSLADISLQYFTGNAELVTDTLDAFDSFFQYVNGSTPKRESLFAPGNLLHLQNESLDTDSRCAEFKQHWIQEKEKNKEGDDDDPLCTCLDIQHVEASNIVAFPFGTGLINHHLQASYANSLKTLFEYLMAYLQHLGS